MSKSVYSETYGLENGSVRLIEYTRSAHAKTPGPGPSKAKGVASSRIVGNLIVSEREMLKEFRVTKDYGEPSKCKIEFEAPGCAPPNHTSKYPEGSTVSEFSQEDMTVEFEKDPMKGEWDIGVRESINMNCGNLYDGGDVYLGEQIGRVVSFDQEIDEQVGSDPVVCFLDNRDSGILDDGEIDKKDHGLVQAIKGVVGQEGFKVWFSPGVDGQPIDFTEEFNSAFAGQKVYLLGMI